MSIRSLLGLLLAALALVASACSGGGSDTGTATGTTEEAAGTEAAEPAATGTEEAAAEPAATGTDAPVVRADADLVIWGDANRVRALGPIAEQFGADNGVEVAIQEVSVSQLSAQFSTAAPAGEGPDLLITAHDAIGALVTNGLLAPVDLADPAAFAEVAINGFTYDGQLYGVPYAIENIALVRNTDLVPDAPATFEDLEATALELQESGEVEFGLALQADPPDPYHNYPLFSAFGGSVFAQNEDGSYDGSQLGIDSPEGLAAAEQFGAWVESGLINPNMTYDVMLESFGSGNAAFAITGPWAVTNEEPPGFAAQGVPYAISPIPPIQGGTPRPFVGVQGFVISSFSENPLLAQTFAQDVIGSEEVQLALFETDARPPALLSAFEQVQDNPDIIGFGESGQNGQPTPAIPEMGSVWTAWADAYGLIFQGESTPAENFTNAAEQIRALIAG